MSRRPARCTEADIRRAMKVANQAEQPMSVDILPDGTIRIAPLAPVAPVKNSERRVIVL